MAFDPNRPQAPHPYKGLPVIPAFQLASPQFTDGEPLPYELSGDGGGHSPELNWSGAPAATAGFLVTCFDPDAPRPGGFWHWLISDVPADVTTLPYDAGRLPAAGLPGGGRDGAYTIANSAGSYDYIGAAPPPGDQVHRYFFAVHALDVAPLDLPLCEDTPPAEVAAVALPHTIARAVLMGTYRR
jgi:Raf kinase inhibitor-like YbhB/YbcL family protein